DQDSTIMHRVPITCQCRVLAQTPITANQSSKLIGFKAKTDVSMSSIGIDTLTSDCKKPHHGGLNL
ncbi:MAG: hypothetical protein ACREDR_34695, partial [Blastocatellia bacterium]